MLNKKEFVDMVSENTGKTKKEIEESIDLVLDGIKQAVRYYDGVKFIGFGTFDVLKRKARIGHNPGTLEKCHIDARNKPHFKASNMFTETLNYKKDDILLIADQTRELICNGKVTYGSNYRQEK